MLELLRRMRKPKHHNFRLGDYVEEEGIEPRWARRKAVCLNCREQRLVFYGVDMDVLNLGKCEV